MAGEFGICRTSPPIFLGDDCDDGDINKLYSEALVKEKTLRKELESTRVSRDEEKVIVWQFTDFLWVVWGLNQYP